MNESAFDPQTFMNIEIAGEMETRYTPVTPGTYPATIDGIDIREVTNDRGSSFLLDVTYLIHDEALAEAMGMERVTVRQGIFLEVEPNGNIALGPNKNVKLGRLREAVGQNKSGPWSFAMLQGAGPVNITVSNAPDKNDPTIVYSRVDKVVAI